MSVFQICKSITNIVIKKNNHYERIIRMQENIWEALNYVQVCKQEATL